MLILVEFIGAIARLLLSVYSYLLVARAILPFFPVDEDGPLISFVFTVTEPLVAFSRSVLDRIPAFASMPVDLSLVFSLLIIAVVEAILLAF